MSSISNLPRSCQWRSPLLLYIIIITRCGPLKPFGDIDLSQQWRKLWLVAWRHQAITCTNVDLSSVGSFAIRLKATAPKMLMKKSPECISKLFITNQIHIPSQKGSIQCGLFTHVSAGQLVLHHSTKVNYQYRTFQSFVVICLYRGFLFLWILALKGGIPVYFFCSFLKYSS